jgi:hypothetical protein
MLMYCVTTIIAALGLQDRIMSGRTAMQRILSQSIFKKRYRIDDHAITCNDHLQELIAKSVRAGPQLCNAFE